MLPGNAECLGGESQATFLGVGNNRSLFGLLRSLMVGEDFFRDCIQLQPRTPESWLPIPHGKRQKALRQPNDNGGGGCGARDRSMRQEAQGTKVPPRSMRQEAQGTKVTYVMSCTKVPPKSARKHGGERALIPSAPAALILKNMQVWGSTRFNLRSGSTTSTHPRCLASRFAFADVPRFIARSCSTGCPCGCEQVAAAVA